jgi:predicted RNA polymerase sigma factor
MLLTDARRAARTGPGGVLVPLAEQDRLRWDGGAIEEGVALLTAALRERPLGPYPLQAAIAALHAEAPSAEGHGLGAGARAVRGARAAGAEPGVTLKRAVAAGMAEGPAAGLALLDGLEGDPRLAGHHRLWAVRAHLLERAGDPEGASAAYVEAARRADSVPRSASWRRARRL